MLLTERKKPFSFTIFQRRQTCLWFISPKLSHSYQSRVDRQMAPQVRGKMGIFDFVASRPFKDTRQMTQRHSEGRIIKRKSAKSYSCGDRFKEMSNKVQACFLHLWEQIDGLTSAVKRRLPPFAFWCYASEWSLSFLSPVNGNLNIDFSLSL